jgi:hypothetical protein
MSSVGVDSGKAQVEHKQVTIPSKPDSEEAIRQNNAEKMIMAQAGEKNRTFINKHDPK